MLFDLFFACWFTLKLLAGSAMVVVVHVPILPCSNNDCTSPGMPYIDLCCTFRVSGIELRCPELQANCPYAAVKYKEVQPTLSRVTHIRATIK